MSSSEREWPFAWGRPGPTTRYSDDELDEAWRELNSHVVDDPQPLQFAVTVNCTGLRETYAALAALMDQVSETMRAGSVTRVPRSLSSDLSRSASNSDLVTTS